MATRSKGKAVINDELRRMRAFPVLKYCVRCGCIVRWIFTDVLEDCAASFFMVGYLSGRWYGNEKWEARF
jgi:hypothetical protein